MSKQPYQIESNNLDLSSYLDRFRVLHPQVLFEPTFEDLLHALTQSKCPLCGNKLREMKSRPVMYCNGKKHYRTFMISGEKFKKFQDIKDERTRKEKNNKTQS